ncbi:hypothetical protein ACFL35_15660 [Candidatus Riflebacteria bacterium]
MDKKVAAAQQGSGCILPLISMLITVLICLLLYNWGTDRLMQEYLRLEAEKDNLKVEIGAKSIFFTQKEEQEGYLADIGEQIELLKNLQGNTQCNLILEDLKKMLSVGSIWLTDFRLEKGNVIELSGICNPVSPGSKKGIPGGIVKLTENIRAHPAYEKVVLLYFDRDAAKIKKMVNFKISYGCKKRYDF